MGLGRSKQRVHSEDARAGRSHAAPRTRFFDALHPLAVFVAVCGLVPIAFKPLRVSFHPWRSTLLYSLVVNAAVLWSVRGVVLSRGAVFRNASSSQVQRFTGLTSLAHVGGYVILPFVWMECRKVQSLAPLAAPLEASFGELLGATTLTGSTDLVHRPWPGRGPRWLVRLVLVHSLLVGPFFVAGWIEHVAPDGAHWVDFPGHLYQIILTDMGVGCFGGSLLVVSDLAGRLTRQFTAELLVGPMPASRVRDFRLAWVQLRRLAERCVSMPATLLAIIVYVMLQTLLNTYQGLVSIMAGFQTFAAICFLQSFQIFMAVVLVCDAGHRAVQAVQHDFLTPLQKVFYTHVPSQETIKQMRTFLSIVTARAPYITCGGFCYVTRNTVSGMVAAMVSYLIILVQFRQAEQMQEQSALLARATADALDSCNC